MVLAGFPVNQSSMYADRDGLNTASSPATDTKTFSLDGLSSEGRNTSTNSSAATKAAMVARLTTASEEDASTLLELAANNDLDGFKRFVDRLPSAVDEIGLWYGRKKGTKQMALEQRTPHMVAATYGSVDVLKLIISLSTADVNRRCGSDGTTALHCAASGGSTGAVDAVKLLLGAGADPNAADANGQRPFDVIVVSPKCFGAKVSLRELLGTAATVAMNGDDVPRSLRISISPSSSDSPPLSSSVDEDGSPSSDSTSSPMTGKFQDLPAPTVLSEKKEYPVDPSLPDIKNSIYATDEFRMFSFKVRPCSRAYSHDWTECPFVHPGENARRRDPRKYHYSCVPCPDFRKGACRRGDLCEYAHGVFECWLHPAQYRTRLCKDGTSCARRVCFFAHTSEELRPLYVSTGSAVPSPRSSASVAMELAAAMSMLPGSPSSMPMMSLASFTPPLSPSAGANGIPHSPVPWPQPNVPTLNLPGSNLQSSRLRSSLSARDIPAEDFAGLPDLDSQLLLNDLTSFSSTQGRLGSLMGSLSSGRSKGLAPSNLEDLFSAEISSPRFDADQGTVFSPSHKAAVLNQFQQQGLLSPINTGVFSPRNVDPALAGSHSSLLQASLGMCSPGRMSPRCVEPISPMGGRLASLAQREKQQQQLRALTSRELGSGMSPVVGSPVNSSIPKWGSPAGKPDWTVNGDDLVCEDRFRQSSPFDLGAGGDEPDLSWVQSLVKESPPEIKEKKAAVTAAMGGGPANPAPSGNVNGSSSESSMDQTVLGGWLEQMQLDQMVP